MNLNKFVEELKKISIDINDKQLQQLEEYFHIFSLLYAFCCCQQNYINM